MRPLTPALGPLVGRRAEIRRIDELIGAARGSRGGVLVLRGEAGIGKSALLDHARSAASGFRVIHASGSEYETELPHAALHQLRVPVLGHLAELPTQHREALRGASGLATGPADFFRVGIAALELLASAARERPPLCVVDDAQWLDAASSKALAFLARRVTSEPVTIVFAVRLPSPAGEPDELPGLFVDGLSDADARALLAAQSHVTLDEQVRDRLLAEARGNPLALLELPEDNGFALPDTSSVPSRTGRSFRARLTELPAGARLLLTLASADPTGDPRPALARCTPPPHRPTDRRHGRNRHRAHRVLHPRPLLPPPGPVRRLPGRRRESAPYGSSGAGGGHHGHMVKAVLRLRETARPCRNVPVGAVNSGVQRRPQGNPEPFWIDLGSRVGADAGSHRANRMEQTSGHDG
ncbi:ATP-binding protein [Streptomyces lushanensis]|uniref:ATP-binding protein n=1 Tax=Streptomyces lushanensis TaxID=1434255 RepID=UPI000AA0C30C|nr:ATP-binding protein [Streptomyces lushanensis]